MSNYEEVEVVTATPKGSSAVYSSTIKSTVKTGISFGSVLAIVISYTANQSIFWAILHGLLSWIYVIYFIIFK